LELYNDDGSNAYLSLVEVLVVSVVNGIRVDADFLAIFVMLLFQTYRFVMYLDVKLCNNAIYSDICSYILITIDDDISYMYCGVDVGAPGLLLKPGVTEVVSE
jgi:hypothetical protein